MLHISYIWQLQQWQNKQCHFHKILCRLVYLQIKQAGFSMHQFSGTFFWNCQTILIALKKKKKHYPEGAVILRKPHINTPCIHALRLPPSFYIHLFLSTRSIRWCGTVRHGRCFSSLCNFRPLTSHLNSNVYIEI